MNFFPMLRLIAVAAVATVLLGCDEEDTSIPAAHELTRDAIGHYCNMIVADHLGPKGQIILKSQDAPLWFSSARDALAFTMLPGEAKDVAAIYVSDMARASWDSPEHGTWMDARAALYVIESSRAGGMGAAEAVPFSDQAMADAFALEYGGRVVSFEAVPEEFVLGGIDVPATDP